MMMEVTWPQALAFRLRRQMLEERAGRDQLLAVASRTCGLHAQILSAAELAAQARIEGLERGAVGVALWTERALVKTWAMRWTLHLFSTNDYPIYLAALRAFNHFNSERWLRGYGLTPDDIDALLASFRVRLTGEGLTREQLADAVARQSGRPYLRDKLLSGWGPLLKPGAYQGHLIFGPSNGQNVTFVSPRAWLDDVPSLDTHEAQLEIVRRYLSIYGPATPGDFAGWFGMARAHARELFRALGAELVPASVEGWEAWVLSVDVDTLRAAKPSATVRLLSWFDPYTLGLRREREAALPPERKGRIFNQQGWTAPVALAGGYVVATWKYEVKRSRLAITVEPFQPLAPAVRAGIDAEAARLGAYFEAEPEVRFADEPKR